MGFVQIRQDEDSVADYRGRTSRGRIRPHKYMYLIPDMAAISKNARVGNASIGYVRL